MKIRMMLILSVLFVIATVAGLWGLGALMFVLRLLGVA